MKPTHLLAGMLAAAAILIDLVAVTGLTATAHVSQMVFWGLAFGQLAFLSSWLVFGSGGRLIRLLAVTAAAALIGWPIGTVTAGGWSTWFAVMCAFSVAISGPLAAARWWGFRVSVTSDEDARGAVCRSLSPAQFSLGGMMSLMSAAAIVLGLSRYVTFPWPHVAALLSYGLCLILIALMAFWATVSRGAAGLRLLGLASLCVVAGVVMSRVEYAYNPLYFTVVAFSEAIFICVGIAVLQAGGLRFGTRSYSNV